ncbi:MAG: YtxH domain-containing protein [bacterium]
MSKSSDCAVVFGIGLLAGVAAGAVAALLTTPKSGEEVRQELKATLNRFVDDMPEEYRTTEAKSKEMIVKLKYSFESQFGKINNAIKAAKLAAAKRKEELESDYSV